MAETDKMALLIDGCTLYGFADGVVSWRFAPAAAAPEQSGGASEAPESDAPASDATPAADASDSPAPALPAGNDADALPSRAGAMELAVRQLAAEDGIPLALPPDILAERILSLPALDGESLGSMVRLAMEKFAPVSSDDLVVAYEVVGATESATRVFAAAVPNETLDALAEDLATSGLLVTRLDSSLLCEWKSFAAAAAPADTCRAVVFALPSGRFDLVVADGSGPFFARTLGVPAAPADLIRELTLSLLDISSDASGAAPESVTLVACEGLDPAMPVAVEEAFGMAPELVPESSLAPYVESAADREAEGGCIDIVPPAWREEEKAQIADRRFRAGIVVAVVVWALLAAVLYAIPRMIDARTAAIGKERDAIAPAYRAVSDTRTRVRLIRSYEDRSRSLLDVLKQVCVEMPESIVFSSLTYEKGGESVKNGRPLPGGIKIAGDADQSQPVLDFKDVLDDMGFFVPAKLTGPTMDGSRRRFKFEIDSRFQEEDRP